MIVNTAMPARCRWSVATPRTQMTNESHERGRMATPPPTKIGECQQADGDRSIQSEFPAFRPHHRPVDRDLQDHLTGGHADHQPAHSAEVAASQEDEHGHDRQDGAAVRSWMLVSNPSPLTWSDSNCPASQAIRLRAKRRTAPYPLTWDAINGSRQQAGQIQRLQLVRDHGNGRQQSEPRSQQDRRLVPPSTAVATGSGALSTRSSATLIRPPWTAEGRDRRLAPPRRIRPAPGRPCSRSPRRAASRSAILRSDARLVVVQQLLNHPTVEDLGGKGVPTRQPIPCHVAQA